MFERRSSCRVNPDEALPLTLACAHGALAAEVLELSERALRVRFVGPPGPACEAEEYVAGRLVAPGGEVVLRRLELHCQRDGAAVIAVHDPESRALLWDVCDRLRNPGRGRAAERGEHPGCVPAKGHYTEPARRERLEWMRDQSGAELASQEATPFDARKLTGNIENLVGSVSVPVGLAGPLLFDGDAAQGYVAAPLATTEGTLVASTSRGATAITRSGGVMTQVIRQRMVRAPVYELAAARQALRFGRWVEDHMEDIRREVGLVSSHAELVEVEPWYAGRAVHLRFLYETGDAAGQNMTTACTWRACQWINEAIGAVPDLDVASFAIEGNASGDKKASFLNYLSGRGCRVTAQCVIDRDTLRDVLKTTPEAMERMHRLGALAGTQTGMLGYSINVSNVIAAMFLATGQDAACVHESGAGIFSLEVVPEGLAATVVLPNLVVGTVGGGTALPAQNDFLQAIGCAGSGGVERLAEIICGFALALDLSTLAAVTGGQFADAHERLGRNRPVEAFGPRDLDAGLLAPMLRESSGSPALEVDEVEALDCEMGASILSEQTARGVGSKQVGLFPLRVRCRDGAARRDLDLIAKLKPLDAEVVIEVGKVASLCGGDVAREYSRWRDWTGFKGCHTRELAIYRSREPALRAVLPRVHGVHEDPGREAYAIVMELLGDGVVLRDSAERPQDWSEADVDAAIEGIAGVHAAWLGQEERLLAEGWAGPVQTAERMAEMRPLWHALARHAAVEYPDWSECFDTIGAHDLIEAAGAWWGEIETLPRTLVHNDFNPRNIALRAESRRLVAYDWELATLHLPQRDLAELLAFTLPAGVAPERVARHVETHRAAVASAAGAELDPETWRRGYELALRDFAITRLGLYLMGHAHREYGFLDHVVRATARLFEIEREHRAPRAAPPRRELLAQTFATLVAR